MIVIKLTEFNKIPKEWFRVFVGSFEESKRLYKNLYGTLPDRVYVITNSLGHTHFHYPLENI